MDTLCIFKKCNVFLVLLDDESTRAKSNQVWKTKEDVEEKEQMFRGQLSHIGILFLFFFIFLINMSKRKPKVGLAAPIR